MAESMRIEGVTKVQLDQSCAQKVALDLLETYLRLSPEARDKIKNNEKDFIKLYRKCYAATFFHPEEAIE